jgi:hypothetical protein
MDPKFFRKYSDLIVEAENLADINQVAAGLEFLPTTKLPKQYKYVENGQPHKMPPMTYTQVQQQMQVDTITGDGKETTNTAEPGDIMLSGPSQENYVIKSAKFGKLYQGEIGSTVVPEQSPRQVAVYTAPQAVQFTAPWGESMVIKPGDYLVRDGDAGYYRIAKAEYEQTYNQPGK